MQNRSITILGAGAWGTAVGLLLARNSAQVLLWAREQDVVQDINSHHRNTRYLPDVTLPTNLSATTDLAAACAWSDLLFVAIPVAYLRTILDQARPCLHRAHTFVMLCKGMEQESLRLPTQIITHTLGTTRHAVLAGPSFAVEVAQEVLTGFTLATDDDALRKTLIELICNTHTTLKHTDDQLGTQVGGAIKNVLALAGGMLHSKSPGANSAALLLTQGLQETATLAHYYGGRTDTVYGLSGLGDLVLTSSSSKSKNFSYGLALGKGIHQAQLKTQFPTTPEGVNTAYALARLMELSDVELPLCTAVHQILLGKRQVPYLLDVLRG